MNPTDYIARVCSHISHIKIEEVAHSPYSYKMYHVGGPGITNPAFVLFRSTSMGWMYEAVLEGPYEHWMKWFWATKMPKRAFRTVKLP